MKHNLLIGTSLVAAFATTSLSARAVEADSNTSRELNNQIVTAHVKSVEDLKAEYDTKATPLKSTTGVTLLNATLANEAGREAVAKILKAATDEAKTAAALRIAFDNQTPAQKKATVAEIAKALALNAELRKLVADFHPVITVTPEEAAKLAAEKAEAARLAAEAAAAAALAAKIAEEEAAAAKKAEEEAAAAAALAAKIAADEAAAAAALAAKIAEEEAAAKKAEEEAAAAKKAEEEAEAERLAAEAARIAAEQAEAARRLAAEAARIAAEQAEAARRLAVEQIRAQEGPEVAAAAEGLLAAMAEADALDADI
jgi:hypothetical protein